MTVRMLKWTLIIALVIIIIGIVIGIGFGRLPDASSWFRCRFNGGASYCRPSTRVLPRTPSHRGAATPRRAAARRRGAASGAARVARRGPPRAARPASPSRASHAGSAGEPTLRCSPSPLGEASAVTQRRDLPQSALIWVESTPAEQRVEPGDQAVFAIVVENRSTDAQQQTIAIGGIPSSGRGSTSTRAAALSRRSGAAA